MKKITSLVASVSALLLITSCSHEADFDSTAYVQQKKNEYAQNFVKRYGEIDPNHGTSLQVQRLAQRVQALHRCIRKICGGSILLSPKT